MNDESDKDRAFSFTAAFKYSIIISDKVFIMNIITDANAIITDAFITDVITNIIIIITIVAADVAVNTIINKFINEVNLSVSINTFTAAALKDVSINEAV